MKLSDYVKVYRINDDAFAYYHSLRMIPVYVSRCEHELIQSGKFRDIQRGTLDALRECRILVDGDEAGLIESVQRLMPEPYICIAYFILTEQCNLACRYCFMGNASERPKATDYPMSIETAEKALLFFAEQTRKAPEYFDEEKSIIFYGGEPLLNFEAMKFTVERCRELQQEGRITRNLNFTAITNGFLLDRENISFMRDNNIDVSVSLDGAGEESNSSRVDHAGKTVYRTVIEKLGLAASMGLPVSLSVTITESTLDDMAGLIEFLDETGIKSLCFNIMQRIKDFHVGDEYYARASNFITEFYRRTKRRGIYEDRFMRKLKSFASQKFYFADCAACSGNQIVITPDGRVGICQGCAEDRRYFITDVNSPEYDVRNDKTARNWLKKSPFFRKECRKCEALGLCGGGCPVNSPETFCIHAKSTLEFLVRELYSVMQSGSTAHSESDSA